MGRESLQSRKGLPPLSRKSPTPLRLTRYYPLFRTAIPLNWIGPHVLLSRLPLPSLRKERIVRLAWVRHAASVRPEPGSNSPQKQGYPVSWIATSLQAPRLSKAFPKPSNLSQAPENIPAPRHHQGYPTLSSALSDCQGPRPQTSPRSPLPRVSPPSKLTGLNRPGPFHPLGRQRLLIYQHQLPMSR